jgi:hypothetical protein
MNYFRGAGLDCSDRVAIRGIGGKRVGIALSRSRYLRARQLTALSFPQRAMKQLYENWAAFFIFETVSPSRKSTWISFLKHLIKYLL